jgi:perosamine synthetase
MQSKPARQVRLFKPCVGEEELANIRAAFERGWLGLGPAVNKFEQEWSAYVGVPTSVGVNSGTAALHLARAAYGFAPGSRALVPAMSFVATATAALYNQLEPVFVDIDPQTLSLSLDDLERKADAGCVAVIPVHFGGHPVPMEALLDIARAQRWAVIEDCAHCAGGNYHGRKLGTWGDIGCFSFEEKKSMTTGDGGMLSSHDKSLIEPLRAHRWVGIDKDTWKRLDAYTDASAMDARHWYYEVAVLGYKYNMNDLMASIGLAQLKKLDRMNARRRQIIARYLAGIESLRQVSPLLPYSLDGAAYWLFGLRCARRDDLIRHLKKRGIATSVHYMPIPMHPLFRKWAHEIPVAREVWQTIVTLPLFPDLVDDDVDYVVDAVREFDRA